MYCSQCGCDVAEEAVFWQRCGTKRRRYGALSYQVGIPQFHCEKDSIVYYFNQNFRYKAICMFLKTYHSIDMSIRTLKKHDFSTSEAVIRQVIEQEIEGPFSLKGYRTMWNTLRTRYGIRTQRDTVMKSLREIDPQASRARQARRLHRRRYISPGPNACWHVDMATIS